MSATEIRGAWRIAAMLFLLALPVVNLAEGVLAREVPPLKGRVNDNADMLSASTEKLLESTLQNLESTDSTQIVLLTIPSLAGENLENYSLKVVENWQIGQQEFDNGALLLIARDDRKMRIEVGYGLEGTLTDLVSGQIIRNVITPQFRQGRFNEGVLDGIDAMVAAVKGEYEAGSQRAAGNSGRPDVGGLITALLFIFFFFGSMFRKNKLRASIIGGVAAPVLGGIFFGIAGLALLALIPIGIIGGLAASALAASSGGGRSGAGGYYLGTGGRFGGSSGGFGGFSGGGGGFGGGGASGGW